MLSLALIGLSFAAAVAIYYLTVTKYPEYPFLGSSVARDSITVEIVETAPGILDNPNIENTPDVWLELIENANQTIDIEVYTTYSYSSGPIADYHSAIYDAAARGVKVRMLIDNSCYQDARSVMDAFDNNDNIEVRQHHNMHSKMIIVDNEMAYVGSANQSYTAMNGNRELGVLISGSELAQALEAIFEAGWTGEKNQPGFENGWTIDWIYPVATPLEVPGWVAGTEETIIEMINSAQHTIHAPIYSLSDYAYTLHAAIENAAGRGVDIKIMVDDYWYFDIVGELDAKYPNVQTKTVSLGGYQSFHCKAVVVDGKWAYVGSANWSETSMTSRREIGIAFEDQTLASALEEIFRTDWNSRYAEWVMEPPSPLAQILINAGIVLAVLVLGTVVILYWRRAKSKHKKRRWISELWASSRHEV